MGNRQNYRALDEEEGDEKKSVYEFKRAEPDPIFLNLYYKQDDSLFDVMAKWEPLRIYAAINWLENKTEPSAYRILAKIYHRGYGGFRNMERALKYYKAGCDLGDTFMLYSMGVLYFNGDDVVRDDTKAYYYFNECTKKNDKLGYFGLGMLYWRGFNGRKDLKQSLLYLKKSFDLGYSKAMDVIKKICIDHYQDVVNIITQLEAEKDSLEKTKHNLEKECEKMRAKIEELEILAPIEGGDEYKSALARYEQYKHKKA